ncbi:hypothetical protein VTI28DRAFT_8514 [Corynascus sepedonium]
MLLCIGLLLTTASNSTRQNHFVHYTSTFHLQEHLPPPDATPQKHPLTALPAQKLYFDLALVPSSATMSGTGSVRFPGAGAPRTVKPHSAGSNRAPAHPTGQARPAAPSCPAVSSGTPSSVAVTTGMARMSVSGGRPAAKKDRWALNISTAMPPGPRMY